MLVCELWLNFCFLTKKLFRNAPFAIVGVRQRLSSRGGVTLKRPSLWTLLRSLWDEIISHSSYDEIGLNESRILSLGSGSLHTDLPSRCDSEWPRCCMEKTEWSSFVKIRSYVHWGAKKTSQYGHRCCGCYSVRVIWRIYAMLVALRLHTAYQNAY